MTLIAAFKCEYGAVIAADTQETAGDYRVTVDKIAPKPVGEYELVIGGAGNTAGLIDDFTETFTSQVEGWEAGLSEQAIKTKIREALKEFHRDTVGYYPALLEDKRLQFIICVQQMMKFPAKLSDSPGCFIWQTDGDSLVTVRDYALIGFDDAIYKYEAHRLYSRQISMAQAVMLCINLFTMADATSAVISRPIQVITVRVGGMTLMKPSEVSDLEQRTATFNEALAELVLACPDLSIRNDEFRGLLTKFEERVMQLREHYFDLAATDELDQIQNDPQFSSQPFPTLPGGMLVRGSDGKPELIPHEQINAFLASLPAAEKLRDKIEKQQSAKKKRGRKSKPKASKGVK